MLLDELVKEKNRMSRLEKEAKALLDQAPKGTLRISRREGQAYYYHREKKSSRCGTYVPKSKTALVEGLAKKDYALRLLKKIEKAERLLDELTELYCSDVVTGGQNNSSKRGGCAIDFVEAAYCNLSEERKKLVTPLELPTEAYVSEWMASSKCAKDFRDDDPLLYSDKGERMRSKSEVLIANKLGRFGVPYRYEPALRLEGGNIVYPDFLVLNTRTRAEYVWEHLGMMDSGEYALKALMKIEAYGRSGYLPGENLILTHERSGSPLDTRVVDRLIRTKLL